MSLDKETQSSIIKLLEEIKPIQDELEDFDENRKCDTTYCIEWGMKKQKWLHKLVIERAINDIQLKSTL